MTHADAGQRDEWVVYGQGHSGAYATRREAEQVVRANRALGIRSNLYRLARLGRENTEE